ncbi:MAG TPA: UDP-N-acetylmuramoyl-tripeptide--D-alanyl-D-alanine ligase [Burkholderiales bacterium]|nr:UDP-N-acetylmuramoyl-tripeptide--D-alanyl-D-alanine ligase [Burkholderiales bacterium]
MMSISAAAEALQAHIVGDDVRFTEVSSDTRSIEPGALFIALKGERFDGHNYLDVARDRGAAAAMVAHDVEIDVAGLSLLVVEDTKLGLGALARHWRDRFDIPLIAITGSNGKTTVKEMAAGIAREHFGADAVLATAGNFNNDIGLPLTLLRLREAHECAVIEVGMNHPGETAYLADLAHPNIAVVNNAQREHQEFMKSVTDVALEHAAIIEALPADGVAVFNADDEHASVWRAAADSRTVRDFGLSAAAAVRANYRATSQSAEMVIETPEGLVAAHLQVPGEHNVRNALAATAALTAAGASMGAVARGLMQFRAVKGRLQAKRARNGACIIDDTYNANPDSVRAAIDVLARAASPRVLVLGDMGEVGEQGVAFHAEIGTYAKAQSIDALCTLGALAEHSGRAFGAHAQHAATIEELVGRLNALLTPNGTALIKGSRFMRMERAVQALCEEEK